VWNSWMSNLAPSRVDRRWRKLQDLEQTNGVAAPLARKDDVAVHRGGGGRLTGRLLPVGRRLLSCPALGVDAGVYHQACGARQLELQTAQVSRGSVSYSPISQASRSA